MFLARRFNQFSLPREVLNQVEYFYNLNMHSELFNVEQFAYVAQTMVLHVLEMM